MLAAESEKYEASKQQNQKNEDNDVRICNIAGSQRGAANAHASLQGSRVSDDLSTWEQPKKGKPRREKRISIG
jgi:hypothetical protein